MIYFDLATKKEITLEYAIEYVRNYAKITKYSYQRLFDTIKYQIKGIDTKTLLYKALYEKEEK